MLSDASDHASDCDFKRIRVECRPGAGAEREAMFAARVRVVEASSRSSLVVRSRIPHKCVRCVKEKFDGLHTAVVGLVQQVERMQLGQLELLSRCQGLELSIRRFRD